MIKLKSNYINKKEFLIGIKDHNLKYLNEKQAQKFSITRQHKVINI